MNEDEPTALDLLSPDVILPAQFFDMIGTHRCDNPEKRLMYAVLIDGIHCFKYKGRSSSLVERRRYEAEHWLFVPNLGGVFSLEAVCEGLGIEPEYLRKGLRRLKGDVNMARRHLVHTERRSHPTENRVRVRHDRRHNHHDGLKKRAAAALDLPFVPV